MYKDIFEVINLVVNDRGARSQNIVILIFIIIVAVLFSPFASFALSLFYILGLIVCWLFIKYQRITTIVVKRIINFYKECLLSRKRKLTNSCSICDDLSCIRHQRINSILPWKNLYVHRELNDSLHNFYNKLIDDFVTSWYSELTDDVSFINELRYCLRYASAALIIRYREIDSAELLANKLIPCLVKQIDDYVYIKQFAKLKNIKENEATLNYLGKRLHYAAANRNNELNYLRYIVTDLLKHVLPESYVNCKNFSVLIREILAGWVLLPLMDLIADPNIINLLLLVTLTEREENSNSNVSLSVAKEVEFLDGFVSLDSAKKSPFFIDLRAIKTNNDNLYALMQFLKREGHVHLLQFNLSADDFNSKLLNPDLNKKQLKELHCEAAKIYNEYLNKESYNFIGCCSNESDELKNLIINEGVYNISTLRTCKAWYNVQEHVINVLENIWLPQFFRSNEFLRTICGTKITPTYNKNSTLANKRKYYDGSQQSGTVSKISSSLGKIRGVLKSTQALEGAILQNVEDCALDDMFSANYDLFRDLSTWQVTINSYQFATNKVLYFNVNVQRMDNSKSWIVLRKSQDFFTLKAKLVEFHGENEICDSPLPSRRSGTSIEDNMKKFESFLIKLLHNPTLRGSDLLYTFLTNEGDFTVLMDANVPIIQDFGNIYQSVAYKLRKEKGQHLDNFMNTLLNSTNSKGIEIGSELETTVIVNQPQTPPPLPKTFRNYIFNDNFGIKYDNLHDTHNSWSFVSNGITQSIFYLLKHIMKVNNVILKLYMALCNVAHEFVEYISTIVMKYILKKGLTPANLTYLIKLLEEVLFQERKSPNKLELEERKQDAINKLKECINSSRIARIVGRQTLLNSTILLELLQNPHYNKQCVYNLLDILLYEMYPSIGNTK